MSRGFSVPNEPVPQTTQQSDTWLRMDPTDTIAGSPRGANSTSRPLIFSAIHGDNTSPKLGTLSHQCRRIGSDIIPYHFSHRYHTRQKSHQESPNDLWAA